MAASKVRETFEKGTDAFNRHDVEGFAETMTDDVKTRASGVGELRGKPAVKAFYKGWLDAFPDARVEITSVTITDDLAAEEGVFTGTHRATLHSPGGDIPATGRNVRIEYLQVSRYRGDKISSFHLVFDRLEMLEQLGLAPAMSMEEAGAGRPEAGEGAQAPH
jgi:predicted ester cyclase